ncbi:MAG: hypothetical protein ABR551_02540 [Gemmatimonadales bacterium]
MRLVDPEETVIVVVGTTPAALEHDRLHAERIRDEIDRRGAGQPWRRAVVVSDEQYFLAGTLMSSTVVVIGGPGSNAVAAHYADRTPTVFAQEDRFWVQADFDGDPRRVSLWGVNRAATAEAVTAFLERGYLDGLLERIWRVRPGMVM